MGLKPENVGKSNEPSERSWTTNDVLLYALGVGAGQDDASAELSFTTENSSDVDLQVLPSFANMLGFGGGTQLAGDFDLAAVLHAEQSFELYRPLPPEGTASTVGTLIGIHDKGHAALVVAEGRSTDAKTGELLAICRNTTYIRGAGGFGGERGTSEPWAAPEREPDLVRSATIPADQALLYRLTGDTNPLHSDPSFAKLAGFERPILHGMCTYGYTGRLLLHAVCGSDVARFTAMSARFTDVVYPGDTITVHMWEDGPTVYFRTYARDSVVIDRGVLKRVVDD